MSNFFSPALPLRSHEQRLPQDILDCVIEHAVLRDVDLDSTLYSEDDNEHDEMVESLTLTSHAFLEQVRRLRYRRFTAGLVNLKLEEDRAWFDRLDLYRYVKILIIVDDTPGFEYLSVFDDIYWNWIKQATLLIEKLCNLDRLDVKHLDWSKLGSELRCLLLRKFSQVREITLYDMAFPNTNQLARVFGSFPSKLQYLTLRIRTYSILNHTSRQLKISQPLEIDRLWFELNTEGTTDDALIRLFLGSRSTFALSNIRCDLSEAQLDIFMDLVCRAGSSLQEIEAHFTQYGE